MSFSSAAQAALLKWVNSFPVANPAASMADLADGITLSQLLHALDPSYDPSELDSNVGSSKWLTQKRNLQSVYKGLQRYMRHSAAECLPLARVADFRALAENPTAAGLSQLVAVFLATAVFNSDDQTRLNFINKLQSDFEVDEQKVIRKIVEEKQRQMHELAEAAALEDARDEAAASRDPDLEHEEERLKLVAELEKKVRELDMATKRYADLNTRHLYLQESHDELKAKLADVEGQLEEVKKLHGADESHRVQMLQVKIDEQAALIANQEGEIETYQERQHQLEVEVERFRTASEQAQEYKDKVDELQHQYAEVERRANAADRYKQKLATQRNLEQEIATLQYELEARRELDDKLQRAMLERDRLQATEKEMLAALSTIEQSLNDERNHKEHFKALYDELRLEHVQLEHQNTVNEKYIEDMKADLLPGADIQRTSTPASGDGGVGGSSLEQELQQTTNDLSKVKLLEAEIEVLRHGATTTSQADDLRRELDRARAERDIAVKKYESVFEKHGVAQEQIEALIKNMTGEGHAAFQNLRETHHKTQAELDELKTKFRRLEEAARDKDRDMLSMKTDLDAVGADRLDALERLKQSDQLIAASLRTELDSLRGRYNSLEVENNMHKSQLLEALMAKEKLAKDQQNASERSETPAPAGVDEDALKNYKSKAEKLRERVKSQKEQLEKGDQERYELQKRIKALESGSALAAQKAAHEQIIKNLQRENAMIATAWYDLTSRLQSNHVVLQRKDQPKSWLNKQRQMVNATPRR